MRSLLIILSSIIAVLAILPYIRDTLKHKTRPNIITWFTWTLLNAITSVAAFAGGAIQTGIFAGAVAFVTAVVTIVGLRDGIKKYTAFDYICQALAIAAIMLWQQTGDPATAITITVIASFIGTMPTYRHSWRKPREETWQAYAIDGFAAVLAALSVSQLTYIALAYPIYIVLSDMSLVLVILYRRTLRRVAHAR